jgi:hypothetical protein
MVVRSVYSCIAVFGATVLICRGEDLAQSLWYRLGLAEAASSYLPVLQLDSVGDRWPFVAEPAHEDG